MGAVFALAAHLLNLTAMPPNPFFQQWERGEKRPRFVGARRVGELISYAIHLAIHPPRPSMGINGNQWQSMAINGNQWQSMAINGNQ